MTYALSISLLGDILMIKNQINKIFVSNALLMGHEKEAVRTVKTLTLRSDKFCWDVIAYTHTRRCILKLCQFEIISISILLFAYWNYLNYTIV